MKKIIFGVIAILVLAIATVSLSHGIQSANATIQIPQTPEKEVTLNIGELSCGTQDVSIGGQFQYTVSVSADWLEVKVDGNVVDVIHVSDQDGDWPNWNVVTNLGTGNHSVEINLYDSKDGENLNGLIVSHSTEFEIEECPVDPCNPQVNDLRIVKLDENIECDPTPTPTPGQPGNPPTFAGSSTNAPVCGDGQTTKVVANGHVIRGVNGDFSKAIVNAFITEGDSVNVYWRIVGDGTWKHSSASEYPNGIKPNGDKFISYQVNELDPNGDYDFGIEQKNGCGGGTIAVIKDGAVSKTFTVTSYE